MHRWHRSLSIRLDEKNFKCLAQNVTNALSHIKQSLLHIRIECAKRLKTKKYALTCDREVAGGIHI